ncbi:MAG TPA: hypothetical protein VET26_01275 [Candidatus Sulfotelmatobacter sp.]|nr:hypothetical protein [Candidatus Sulfotelmatobacter sp.]
MSPADRWLVVGHGSVGSAIARRLGAAGLDPIVYDPSPRAPIAVGRLVLSLTAADGPVDYVVSCVPPPAAASVPQLIAPLLHEGTVLFDWNTVSPQAKRAISDRAACEVLDVALLDSLDRAVSRPRLAISGPRAESRRSVLEQLGFHVDVAGAQPGDAALLKYARSIFMKSLEGLVLEYSALAFAIDRQGIVAASIENNLGEQFMRFSRLLIATDRVHASRRATELSDAVEVFRERGAHPEVAVAVAPFLRRLASLWARPDAPLDGADVETLVAYLADNL